MVFKFPNRVKLRRSDPLACLAVGRRVSCAGLDPDRQTHLLDRADQVALNVDGKRLERRDVEGVQPFGRPLDKLGNCRQEARQRLARAGRGDEQSILPGAREAQHVQLVPPRLPSACGKPVPDYEWEIRVVLQRSSVPSRRIFSSSA
jgi:hypothetical protein